MPCRWSSGPSLCTSPRCGARTSRSPASSAVAFVVMNGLPDALSPILFPVMQAGSLLAVFITGGFALLARRPRLAGLIVLAGGSAWILAKFVKRVVERGRPEGLVPDVIIGEWRRWRRLSLGTCRGRGRDGDGRRPLSPDPGPRRRLADRRTRRAVPRLHRRSPALRLRRRRPCRLGHRLADQPGHRPWAAAAAAEQMAVGQAGNERPRPAASPKTPVCLIACGHAGHRSRPRRRGVVGRQLLPVRQPDAADLPLDGDRLQPACGSEPDGGDRAGSWPRASGRGGAAGARGGRALRRLDRRVLPGAGDRRDVHHRADHQPQRRRAGGRRPRGRRTSVRAAAGRHRGRARRRRPGVAREERRDVPPVHEQGERRLCGADRRGLGGRDGPLRQGRGDGRLLDRPVSLDRRARPSWRWRSSSCGRA